MTDQTLETEIENATRRIESRQAEIETELQQLVGKIDKYTTWAWRFVWFGAFVAFVSTIFYLFKNTEAGFGLNLLGDFMAGTVASIWSLSGLFFIYVAFLGQKQQLLNQQLEIMYSQIEVKYTRLELEGQKMEMKKQNQTLQLQRFENTFFNLLQAQLDLTLNLETSFPNYKESYSTEKFTGLEIFKNAFKQLRLIQKSLDYPLYIKNRKMEDYELMLGYESVIGIDAIGKESTFEIDSNNDDHYDLHIFKQKKQNAEINSFYKIKYPEWKEFKTMNPKEKAIKISNIFFKEYSHEFNVYFLHLDTIVDFISEFSVDLDGAKNVQYHKFVKNQRSSPELFLLFYYCIKKDELFKKFKLYGFFEDLSEKWLINIEHEAFLKI